MRKLLTKSNNSNVYKVCVEKGDGSDHINRISESSNHIHKLQEIEKLHTLFYTKLDEYKFLEKYDPENLQREKLRLECIHLAEESGKLVDSLNPL